GECAYAIPLELVRPPGADRQVASGGEHRTRRSRHSFTLTRRDRRSRVRGDMLRLSRHERGGGMRGSWEGAVSFRLVSIGVKLFSATEEKDIRFHQVHRTDGGRIKYKRTCSVCNEEVAYDDIAKGYDLGGGEIVVLTDEDFAELPLSSSRSIDVMQF